MAGVGIRRTGMSDVPVAHLARMIKNANPGAMENSIDGRTERTCEIPTMNGDPVTKTAGSPRERMASRADPNSKEAGSATSMRTMALILLTMINRFATENGVVIDMAQTATGTAAPSSSKSLNGWIAMTEMSHDEHTRRKISSAGRSA